MKHEEWVVDIATGVVTHSSGFSIRVEGNPKDPNEIYPSNFPEGLSFVDQARLLRSGLEALSKSAGSSLRSWQSSPVNDAKTEAIRAREALAKQFAERADKPVRATLSLKKK
jgi:hypothetical protein